MNDELVTLSNQVARSTQAVISTVSQRGAFKGEELTTIGRLYDQCAKLIQLAEQKLSESAEEN